jgi:hypothetical protein
MPSRRAPLILGSFVVAASACVAPWDPPSGVVCERGCSSTTTDPVPASTGELVPTSSTQDPGTTTGEPPGETTSEPGSTTTQGDEGEAVPTIVDFDVTPALMQDNGLIKVSVSTMNADGVRMQLETGDAIELDLERPGFFTGQIGVYTGLENDEHVAVLRPWANVEDEPDVEGEPVDAPFYVALPPPGYEQVWNADPIEGVSGFVVAMAVLPDRRFVELGTYYPPEGPRCFLRVGGEDGHWGPGDFMSVLPSSHCTAIDLTVNPETGTLHVLVNRKGDQGVRWWLGEISSWGKGAKQIGVGEIGDEALALARHPKMLAVCGARKVATEDLDGFAMLVQPGQVIEERLFDYVPKEDPHQFSETVRDCAFAGDTLVLAGQAWGVHDELLKWRDRLAVVEHDVVTKETKWIVAGPGPGVQSRALALAIEGDRYHLAGYTCLDECEPEGDLRTYLKGGKLLAPPIALGPLNSDALGPHDIAWSPAGYMVIALGELQGQSYTFKVQAFKPDSPEPLWTFTPNDKQGLQIAYAVAVDLYGKVCAGGVGKASYPAFACMGS